MTDLKPKLAHTCPVCKEPMIESPKVDWDWFCPQCNGHYGRTDRQPELPECPTCGCQPGTPNADGRMTGCVCKCHPHNREPKLPPKPKDPMPHRIDVAGELIDAVIAWHRATGKRRAAIRLHTACHHYLESVEHDE